MQYLTPPFCALTKILVRAQGQIRVVYRRTNISYLVEPWAHVISNGIEQCSVFFLSPSKVVWCSSAHWTKLPLLSASGKHSHCVMCTNVRELYVMSQMHQNFSINQNIDQVHQSTPFQVVLFTRLGHVTSLTTVPTFIRLLVFHNCMCRV